MHSPRSKTKTINKHNNVVHSSQAGQSSITLRIADSMEFCQKSVLVISRMSQGTSDYTLSFRIRHYFDTSPQIWIARDICAFEEKTDILQYVNERNVTCVFGIDALATGRLLKDCPVPYALIFTGADVFYASKQPENFDTMTFAVLNARHLVATTRAIEEKVKRLWPNLEEGKLLFVPHGVLTCPAPRSSIVGLDKYKLPSDAIVFTMVTRIEQSRDPLHIIPVFTHWHQMNDRRPYLIIIGNTTDSDYSTKFFEIIDGCPGVFHIGVRTLRETHRLIAESFAYINTALHPGTCTAILEDFIDKAEMLVASPMLRRTLSENGKEYISSAHSSTFEHQAYAKMAADLSKACILVRHDHLVDGDEMHERRVRFQLDQQAQLTTAAAADINDIENNIDEMSNPKDDTVAINCRKTDDQQEAEAAEQHAAVDSTPVDTHKQFIDITEKQLEDHKTDECEKIGNGPEENRIGLPVWNFAASFIDKNLQRSAETTEQNESRENREKDGTVECGDSDGKDSSGSGTDVTDKKNRDRRVSPHSCETNETVNKPVLPGATRATKPQLARSSSRNRQKIKRTVSTNKLTVDENSTVGTHRSPSRGVQSASSSHTSRARTTTKKVSATGQDDLKVVPDSSVNLKKSKTKTTHKT